MARYQVPQNIDMEDKIIGPLTMIQFVYLMIGGMIVYLAWTFFDIELFLVTGLPVALLTLALAFVKIQDQPFPKFLAATLLFLVRPKSRVWSKDPAAAHLTIVEKKASKPEETSPLQAKPNRTELGELASVLDTGGRSETGQEVRVKAEETTPPTIQNDQISSTKIQTNSNLQIPNQQSAQPSPLNPEPSPGASIPTIESPADKLKKIAAVAEVPLGESTPPSLDLQPSTPTPGPDVAADAAKLAQTLDGQPGTPTP